MTGFPLGEAEVIKKVTEILEERDCYDVVVHQVFIHPEWANVHVSYKWRLNAWEKVVSLTSKTLFFDNGKYELI